MTQRAVLFDLGGVLIRETDGAGFAAFEARYLVSANDFLRALDSSRAYARLRRGEIDGTAWHAEVSTELASRYSEIPSMLDDWDAIPRAVDARLTELAETLQLAGSRIGVISNAPAGFRDRFEQRYGVRLAWDAFVTSGDAGCAKPDARIYEIAAEAVALPAASCFFIDDKQENVAGARAAGMAAFHFRGNDHDALETALRDHGCRW